MLKFFKNSFRELSHVVWPTREETKRYFSAVILILVLFGIYLFIVSTLFSRFIFFLKEII